MLSHLARVRDRNGALIRLALEPEPHCILETIDETVGFFERMAFPASLSEHIAVCFDCCHQAVEFEGPAECLERLASACGALLATMAPPR